MGLDGVRVDAGCVQRRDRGSEGEKTRRHLPGGEESISFHKYVKRGADVAVEKKT